MKFDNLEELSAERKKVDAQYDGGLPDYLIEYFDIEEQKLINKDFYTKKREEKYSHTFEERRAYKEEQKREFWENNDIEIVKSPKKLSKYQEEPPRAVQSTTGITKGTKTYVKQACSRSLARFAGTYFPHYLKKKSSKMHKWLYKQLTYELSGQKRRHRGMKLAVAAPRGNAKSSIVSTILPLWCICYKKKRFIVMVSDTKSQAEDFLADVKNELEINEKLIEDFPEVVGKGQRWTVDHILTNNDVRVIALGTGSKIRGRKFGPQRPDLVVADDLENADMVRSEAQREWVRYTWFDKDFVFAGAGESGRDDEMTDFFVVGTVLGKESLLNALLNSGEYPEWDSMRFKAVKKFSMATMLWDKWTELYKNRFDKNRKETAEQFFLDRKEEMLEGTEVLWPEGDPYYSLMVDKLKSLSAFLSEKQNEGVDLSKIYVSKEDLHWESFRTNEKVRVAINRAIKRGLVFGALDPSLGKKSKKGDYSCIITLARDNQTGFIFVLDIDLKRRSVDDQIYAILAFHEKFKYKSFGVETNAFQYVVAESLRKKSRKLGYYVPVEEINNYQDKKMRVEGIVPFLKDGTIVFDKLKYDSNQSYNLGIEQICTFTGEGDSEDDAPDCLEMAFRIAKAPRFRMITSQNKRSR